MSSIATDATDRKQLEDQLQLLAEASHSLQALPSDELSATIVKLAQEFIAADGYAVWRCRDDGVWVISFSAGLSKEYVGKTVSPAAALDANAAPIVIPDVTREPLLQRRQEALLGEGIRSMLIVPLQIGDQASGTVVFYWKTPRILTDSEVRLARTIGNLAASALNTAQLYEQQLKFRADAEAAERRSAFLAQCGTVLASSLDYQETLASVARLAVPAFADWAAVDIVEDSGALRRVAVEHSDPEKVLLAYDFTNKYPPGEQDPVRVALRTGKSVMLARLSDEMIDQGARDADHARAVRQLGIRSFIVVPMVFSGQAFGTITFAASESGHTYNAADLATAEELARRAAIAVEHARLHRDVRMSEERFRAIVDTTPECVKVVAADGTLLHMNSSGLAMIHAQRPEDVIGKSLYKLIAPEFREAYRNFHEAICRGEKGVLEFEIVGLTGRRRRVETRATPFREPDGTIVQLAITRDITERIARERAAMLLGAIVDSSDDAIISKDLNGVITSWNGSAERLFGYTAAEVIGRPITILIPHDRLHEEPMILGRLKSGERVDHFDTIRRRKDGTLLNIALTISPVRDAKGNIIGASKIARDITERKRAEAALRVSEAKFRQLADAMPQIVWTARPDGLLDYYNQRWYDFTGFMRDGSGDVGAEAVLHPDDVVRSREVWQRAVQSGRPYQIEHRFWDRQARRWRWFMGRALPIRDDSGNIIKWFGSWTDIDDQKRIEDDLRRANQDLEQVAFSASHDLQEPLRSVKIFTELLANNYSDQLDHRALEYLTYVRSGATRMEMLVRDLLVYTRASNFEQPAEATDAGSALASTLAGLAGVIAENGARVTSGPLPAVRAEATHLQQLFQNLVGNAIKYRHADRPPTVHIEAERQNEYWVFGVSDNGIGIAPEHKERIFGLFKRLHSNDEYSGTGIGLAICQRIVDRYHGRIWVESELGQGSIFRFTLPV